jgi:hypothetical protein
MRGNRRDRSLSYEGIHGERMRLENARSIIKLEFAQLARPKGVGAVGSRCSRMVSGVSTFASPR